MRNVGLVLEVKLPRRPEAKPKQIKVAVKG